MAICRKICCCDCSEDPAVKAQQQYAQEMKQQGKYAPSNPASSGAEGRLTRAGSLLQLNTDPLLMSSPLVRPHNVSGIQGASNFELQPSPNATMVDSATRGGSLPGSGLRSPGQKRQVRFSDTPADPPQKMPPGTPVRGIYRHQSSFGPNGPVRKRLPDESPVLMGSSLGSSSSNVNNNSFVGVAAFASSFSGSGMNTFGPTSPLALGPSAAAASGGLNSNLVSPMNNGGVEVTGGREPPDLSLL